MPTPPLLVEGFDLLVEEVTHAGEHHRDASLVGHFHDGLHCRVPGMKLLKIVPRLQQAVGRV